MIWKWSEKYRSDQVRSDQITFTKQDLIWSKITFWPNDLDLIWDHNISDLSILCIPILKGAKLLNQCNLVEFSWLLLSRWHESLIVMLKNCTSKWAGQPHLPVQTKQIVKLPGEQKWITLYYIRFVISFRNYS